MQNSQANENEQDRGETRNAIVAAARTVAERDGVEAVTLSKVAVEAGLPRASVYGQFTRKEDLIMSVVSDDLASLARGMRGIDWPKGGETPESAVVVALPRPEESTAEPVQTPAQVIDLAKDVSAALSATADATSLNERRLARRADLMRVLEAKAAPVDEAPAAVAEPPPPEKSPPRADAWLERRLRVFEKGMAAMEARQEQVEKNARAVVVAAEENIKALEATVKELTARADAGDARHKASSNEVRAALNETALRIQTVEGVARAALAENKTADAPEALNVAPQPVAEPVREAAASLPDSAPEPAGDVDAEAKPEAPKSKIAEVRASVAAASAAAAVDAEAREAAKAARDKRNRSRYLLGGLIVVVVFAAAATMAFSKGVADGRRDALHHMTRTTTQGATASALNATPLDQLTARAQAGDATAEYVVATKYLHGSDTAKNPGEGLHWMMLSAAHGLPIAQYMLGSLYTRGVGATADAGKALQWYEAAALQGNRKAMHGLAVAYAQGAGTAQNLPEAVRWFSRAAQLGYVDSQFNLAVLYERGDGVPQSLLDAYKWYLVASRNGDPESKDRVETLRTQMSADDLAAATHAANAFQAAPFDVAANTVP